MLVDVVLVVLVVVVVVVVVAVVGDLVPFAWSFEAVGVCYLWHEGFHELGACSCC